MKIREKEEAVLRIAGVGRVNPIHNVHHMAPGIFLEWPCIHPGKFFLNGVGADY